MSLSSPDSLPASNDSEDENLREDAKKALRYLQNYRRYRYIEFLDEGGYGWVALMYDDSASRLLAIKCTNDPSELELTRWPELHHPNVMPLLEALTMDTTTVFVMPAHRRDLFRHVVDGTFYKDVVSFGLCRVWLKDVASGLAYLHGLGLCHLDLKLDNVFLKDDGHVCVGDFSLLSPLDAVPPEFEFLEMQRPPEYVQLWEDDDRPYHSISLHGDRIDMWEFGIMSVDLLTHLKLNDKTSSYQVWRLDVLPFVHKIQQNQDYWHYLLEGCFGHNMMEEEAAFSHDFVCQLLSWKSKNRMTALEASRHAFVDIPWPEIERNVSGSDGLQPEEDSAIVVKQEFSRPHFTPAKFDSRLFAKAADSYESQENIPKKKKKKKRKKLAHHTEDHKPLNLTPTKIKREPSHSAVVNDEVVSKRIFLKKKIRRHDHKD